MKANKNIRWWVSLPYLVLVMIVFGAPYFVLTVLGELFKRCSQFVFDIRYLLDDASFKISQIKRLEKWIDKGYKDEQD